jgi:Cu-Zn family superoxide dismutase
MRITRTVLCAVVSASVLVFAGTGQAAAAGKSGGFHVVSANGTFGAFSPDATAVTYNPALVPVGSRAHVFSLSAPSLGTSTVLAVQGLVPGREYGAHAHAKACGATGDVAGPHFQYAPDPVTPSVDPAYANPRNEIWLDFTADRLGTGVAVSRVAWSLDDGRPKSVVIHEAHTHTDPGHAGTAGARLACVNVDF